MEHKIQIEVFRDELTPDIDTSIALKGIAHVIPYTRQSLEVIKSSETLQLTDRDNIDISGVIHADDITWPKPASVLNLVLTGRDLEFNGAYNILGLTNRKQKYSGGTAVVATNPDNIIPADFTVAHELGHLLGMFYGANDDQRHCYNPSCIMRGDTSNYPAESLVGSIIDEALRDSFCDPCKSQLGDRALHMLRFRNGFQVDKHLR